MNDPTQTLLSEWQAIEERENRIAGVLLRQAAAIEDSRRRLHTVSVADLQALRDSMASLEGVMEDMRARVAQAEGTALPGPAPTDTNGHGEPNGAGAGEVPAAQDPPPAAPTIEQIEQRLGAQVEEAAQIRALLRDRLAALGATPDPAPAPAVAAAVPTAAPAAPAAPAPEHRTFKLGHPPMTGSDVKYFQRDLNRRFVASHVGVRIREDGHYGTATRDAARRALLGLGVDPAEYAHGITPQLRVLIRKPSLRTPAQVAQATARRPAMKALHAKVAAAPPAAPARLASTAEAIRAHGGHWEDVIVREAKRHGLPVSLVCAVLECETSFRNVFGHDAVANPIKSPPNGLLAVTQQRYKAYVEHRDAGQGCQGVGPMQLTSKGLQDRADALGGCWKASVNIRVGCELLAGNIKRLHGTRAGVRAYNGSGPAAERYATRVLARQEVWHKLLTTAKAGAPAQTPKAPAVKHAPRTFKLHNPALTGTDVKQFQRALNQRFDAWRIATHVSEDGAYGPGTEHAAHQVLIGLGIATEDYAHGITPQLRSKVRNPSLRTPAELARAKTRAGYLAKLRKRLHASGGGALRLRAYAEARRMLDLGVRESGGNNRGKIVLEIIRANGGPGPEAWCGDFMAWCYRKAGSKAVTRNWAAVRAIGGLAGVKRTKAPLKGNLIHWSFDHVSMFVSWCDASGREVAMNAATHVKSIDGNTTRAGAIAVNDSAGGGDGIYLKVRPRSLVTQFLHISR